MSANLKDTITHYYKDRIHPAMITVWVKDSGPDAVWSFIQTDDVESWKRFEFYLKELQAPNIAISGLFVLLAGKFPSAPLGKIGPYGFYLIRYPRTESRQARRFEERKALKRMEVGYLPVAPAFWQ